jgi:phospholipid/cholesterol/gamma-HCH transport system ATP-binding protein
MPGALRSARCRSEWTCGADATNQEESRVKSATSTPGRPPAEGDAHVVLDGVAMAYGEREVFRDLSCSFPRGKISVVLGGSGSGKSTVLRLIAGLVHPTGGRILVDGADIGTLRERDLFAVRRNVGMMFQHGALLDSKSVFENVAFPLVEHSRLTREQITEEVHKTLSAVGLTNVDELLPGELSGGMLKRVALARALIQKPTIVLVDEAFSGLDSVSVKLIEALLVRINRTFGMTMISVSHHIPTTMRMADKVVLLLSDDVVQGTPEQVAHHPNARVRRFFDEESVDDPALAGREASVGERGGAARRGARP